MYLDWIAMIFTALNVWLLGSQDERGWWLGMIGNVLWISYSAATAQLPLLILNVLFLGLNVRGMVKWRSDDDAP
jgi:hypothetical protein